jgi:hypothetical protein
MTETNDRRYGKSIANGGVFALLELVHSSLGASFLDNIYFQIWLIGGIFFLFAGTMATWLSGGAPKVVWYQAALAYIFWPISIIAVVVWVIWARMQGGRR